MLLPRFTEATETTPPRTHAKMETPAHGVAGRADRNDESTAQGHRHRPAADPGCPIPGRVAGFGAIDARRFGLLATWTAQHHRRVHELVGASRHYHRSRPVLYRHPADDRRFDHGRARFHPRPHRHQQFVCLALAGYYTGTDFHRIFAGTLVQGGDPTGAGTGNPGYTVPSDPTTGRYPAGSVAMANAAPDRNGSQFFIAATDLTGRIPDQYPNFGQVTSGMEVVLAISNGAVTSAASGEQSKTVAPAVLSSVTIQPGSSAGAPVGPVVAPPTRPPFHPLPPPPATPKPVPAARPRRPLRRPPRMSPAAPDSMRTPLPSTMPISRPRSSIRTRSPS